MPEFLAFDFMRASLLAALLVGTAAPMVGIHIVQRQMSLIGDGLGHVALAGVGIGVVTGNEPVFTALIVTAIAAVAIELIRSVGRTSGDLALAVMFYGGIALGVVLLSKAPAGTPANTSSYLFGAINTVTNTDLATFTVLAVIVVATTTLLRSRLYAIAQDEDFARSAGLPVVFVNILLSVLTAVTVVVSMRVVGLLLISALMILPNATGQTLGRSFRSSLWLAVGIGIVCSTGGVIASYYADTPSGGSIVLVLIAVFAVAQLGAWLVRVVRGRHQSLTTHPHVHWEDCGHEAVAHGDHVDYVHDGQRHAAHGDHWDEHGPDAEKHASKASVRK